MATVSVIIPAYNGDRFIGEAIDIFNQTYTDYSVIVVDDGSTDNTSEIVKSFGDRVTYISQQNQGVASARNRGLKASRSNYVAFLDQDDYFLPHKLSSQVKLLEEQPSLGIANSGWQIVNQAGDGITAVEPWHNMTKLDLEELIVWKPVFLGAMLFRRSWLDRTEGFDITLEQTPDVDLVLRLASMGCRGDWVKDITVHYRQHSENASGDTIFQAKELNYILERFFNGEDIPAGVKILESESRYQSLVWSAWRLYETKHLEEMSYYLEQSLKYTEKYPTEIVMDWIDSFKRYSNEYGRSIDISSLSNSPLWQQLVRKCIF